VENDDAERTEMEVGVRGGVYNVSNVEGMAKITPKTLPFADHPVQAKVLVSQRILRITSRFAHREKFILNFSILSFAFRFNLLHP